MANKYTWDSGTKYGMLMCTGKSYKDEKSRRHIEVICECGNVKFVRLDTVVTSFSCGCFLHQNKRNTKHGLWDHPIRKVWSAMMNRCYQTSNNRFDVYGGKGVVVCDDWKNDFLSFYYWALDKWKPGLQLDKDILYKKQFGTNTGMIYSPKYCCFITAKENSRNRTTSVFLEFNGKKLTLAEWAEEIGVSQQVLSKRLIEYKWSVERALTQPLKILKKRLSS